MVAPLLHTRVRDSVHISQSPEEVLARLEALASDQFSIEIDDSDSDNIIFEMLRSEKQTSDITISGIIRRWHGTETRLDFMGEVDVPAPDSRLQIALVVLIVLSLSIAFWRYIILDLGGFMALVSVGRAMLGVIGLWLLVTIVVAWLSFILIVRDTSGGKRWKVQQEMASIIEKIRALKTDKLDTSRLEETEEAINTIHQPLQSKASQH